ncbi:MAG: isoprenylcysteine carboxylmethyltransferase family protein, partial [Anaerolineae bacterium]|nr:isoprenylcysteine carboxylmethyltransferase family protein [Anaerolineae bacterium]
MIHQTIAAILLAIPLVAIVVISVRYWIEFKDSSKRGTAKQETSYNKFFLSLVGLGYFCVWPFWIGGMVLLFLNRYYSILGFLTFSSPSTLLRIGRFALATQVVGFLIFYAGAMMLNWALFVAGKYLRPSIAGVYEEHKLIQTGPLGIVRHPYYVSYVLILVGLSLALLTWWPLVPALCVVIGIYPTARTEEEMLIERFGEEYIEYQRKVGMFF